MGFLFPHLFPSLPLPHSSRRKRSTPCTGRGSERRRERLNPSFFHPWTLSSPFFFFLPPNRGNYQRRNRHRLLTRVMAREGGGGGGGEGGGEVRWLPIGEGIHFLTSSGAWVYLLKARAAPLCLASPLLYLKSVWYWISARVSGKVGALLNISIRLMDWVERSQNKRVRGRPADLSGGAKGTALIHPFQKCNQN